MANVPINETINISVGSSKSSAKSQSLKPSFKFARKKPILFKRRKATGFINFYDLGQISDGAGGWIDLPFSSLWNNASGPYGLNYEFREEHWMELSDLITSVSVEDWATTYRKLTYEEGELYGVDLRDIGIGGSLLHSVGRAESRKDGDGNLITGSGWESEGLKTTSAFANGFAFQDWGLFYSLDTSVDNIKITTTYDPTAGGVEFTLKKDANVYLMPRPIARRATRRGVGENWIMVAPYKPISREFWLNRSNNSDFLPNIFSYNETNITLTPTNSSDLVAEMAADPDTRWFRHVISPPATIELLSDPGGWEEVYFEIRELTPSDFGVNTLIVADPDSNGSPWHIVDGILVGVVEQDDTFYYFWRTEGGDNWIDLGGPCHVFTLT